MDSLSKEAAKPIFVGVLGLLVALVLGVLLGSADYWSLSIITLIFIGIGLWFGTGQWFWLIVIASSFLSGTFPILRGSFTPFHILMALGVAKFFVEDLIMRRNSFTRVERPLLLAIVGFMGVLTWHGCQDRFGMRFLGSTVWGGRNYVSVYVGLIAFFVVQSTSVKSKLWNKLPYLILAVTGFDLFIATITTISPPLIEKIYPFYSAVGTAGITELLTGDEDVAGRIGAFGTFGCLLTMIVLATISVRHLFHPKNLSRLVTLTFASILVLYSGFRSALASWLCAFLLAGFRDIRFRIIAIVPIIAALLFGLSAINSAVIRLPKQIQRPLTFLPGDWDSDMVHDVNGSDDFRRSIWRIWWNEYFPRRPLLGRGFGFQSEWTKTSVYIPTGADYQQMVEVGNIHNGLFASLDAVGIIGTLFFVVWNGQILLRALRVSFDKSNPAGFALRFLALQLGVSIICYWFGASTLGTFLPQQFALAGVFLRLYREAYPKPERASPALQPIHHGRRRVAIGA
jgi:hypothetical protein